MTIDGSVNDLLSGGGTRAAFDANSPVGTVVRGTVVSASKAQQTDFVTKAPLFWDDGKPKEQIVIVLQTADRLDADDDGKRAIYCKGSKAPESMSTLSALIVALREAGADGNLEVGGTLAVAYMGEGAPTKPGLNPPKHWRMQYQRPALVSGLGGADPFGAPQAAQAPPQAAQAPPQAPAPQYAPPPAQAAPTLPYPPQAPQGDPFASAPAQAPQGDPFAGLGGGQPPF